MAAGYAGGAWNGNGINSSAAAVDSRFALGYGEAADVLGPGGGTFAGEIVDGTTLLVRHTLAGDATLDGRADIADFSNLAAGFNNPRGWTGGNFNYDATVNIVDFSLLAANFNQSAAGSQTAAVGRPFSSKRIVGTNDNAHGKYGVRLIDDLLAVNETA
jgi:hypothetical protein